METLLEIVTQACDELGLPRDTSAATSTNPQTRQMVALLNAAGYDLMRRHAWGDLVNLQTFPTVASTSDYSFSDMSVDDFDRFVNETHWDRTNQQFMIGPITPQEDRSLREGLTASVSIYKKYRVLGHTSGLRIWPTPDAVETLVFEYVSNNWARSSAGDGQATFEADSDTSVFDPWLMVKELKFRFRAAKGLEATALEMERTMMRDELIAADLGGRTLRMDGGTMDTRFATLNNVPEGNWSL